MKKLNLLLLSLLLILSACETNCTTPSPVSTPVFQEMGEAITPTDVYTDDFGAMSFGLGGITPPVDGIDTPYLRNLAYIQFDTDDVEPDYSQGQMWWDNTNKTVAVDINDGVDRVTLQMGQEVHVYGENDTDDDWPNGTVLIATGSHAWRPTAILANASYITTCAAQGMTTQYVASHQMGVATTWGMVHDIDTSYFSEGDLLYVSMVSGQLTTTAPITGYNVIFGRVLRSHNEEGSIFVNPRPAPYFGDLAGGDYVAWEHDGTMVFYGDARVWDDIRVPAQATRVNPVSSKPDYEAFIGGTYAYMFDPDDEESVLFSVQTPHGWDLTYPYLEAHMHWSPTDASAGDVVWGIECTQAGIGSTFGATTSISGTDSTDEVAYKHHIGEIGWITITNPTISSMMSCRVYRDADDDLDTYNADVAFHEADFHYLINTIGSREEQEK